jgi:hypothetical protein
MPQSHPVQRDDSGFHALKEPGPYQAKQEKNKI